MQHELSRWLAALPSIFCKSWWTLEPLDIICFLESVWIPNHAGAELPQGKGKVVAPSSLNGGCLLSSLPACHHLCDPSAQHTSLTPPCPAPAATISHISTSMRLIGRTGDWDSMGRLWPAVCNPACSELLRRYKRGYAKDTKSLGYEPCSAFPLAESTYLQLLEGLHRRAKQQAAAADLLSATITWRDGCSISLLWETALRGHDGGILRCNSIKGLDGRPVLPFNVAPSAGDYLVYPWSTKTQQIEPCQPITVTYPR